jgi:hypothetical protein
MACCGFDLALGDISEAEDEFYDLYNDMQTNVFEDECRTPLMEAFRVTGLTLVSTTGASSVAYIASIAGMVIAP